MFTFAGKKIWVAGHRGMVGQALLRRLESEDCEVLTVTRDKVDLRDQAAVDAWVKENKPDGIMLTAARVGGIYANNAYPAEFIYDNLMIECNVVNASHRHGVEKLMFLGSSCIYPKHAEQPIKEESLLSGPLEPNVQWYGVGKIAGVKLCEAYRAQYGCDFISAQPCNLYGPGDSYDPQNSHVLPALLRKFHEAKQAKAPSVVVWGSGTPLREFLHVDDLADALVFLMQRYSDAPPINVGSGIECTISELAHTIAEVVGYEADLVFDPTKPDGTPRKLMDSSRLHAMGWKGARALKQGIADTYKSFLEIGGRDLTAA